MVEPGVSHRTIDQSDAAVSHGLSVYWIGERAVTINQ